MSLPRENRFALLGDDLLQALLVQRLDVGDIRHLRIRHDRGRVGIHQHNLVSQLFQRLAGLGPRIVKFAGLAYDDGAGAYDQYFSDVCSLWHMATSCFLSLFCENFWRHYTIAPAI